MNFKLGIMMLALLIVIGSAVLYRAVKTGVIEYHTRFGVIATYRRDKQPFSFWLVFTIGVIAVTGLSGVLLDLAFKWFSS